jgi:hypothetical protein
MVAAGPAVTAVVGAATVAFGTIAAPQPLPSSPASVSAPMTEARVEAVGASPDVTTGATASRDPASTPATDPPAPARDDTIRPTSGTKPVGGVLAPVGRALDEAATETKTPLADTLVPVVEPVVEPVLEPVKPVVDPLVDAIARALLGRG